MPHARRRDKRPTTCTLQVSDQSGVGTAARTRSPDTARRHNGKRTTRNTTQIDSRGCRQLLAAPPARHLQAAALLGVVYHRQEDVEIRHAVDRLEQAVAVLGAAATHERAKVLGGHVEIGDELLQESLDQVDERHVDLRVFEREFLAVARVLPLLVPLAKAVRVLEAKVLDRRDETAIVALDKLADAL